MGWFCQNRMPLLLMILLLSCGPPATPPEDQLREVLELSSLEMRFREIVYYRGEDRFFFLTYNTDELLFSIEYDVVAGVDLQSGFEAVPDGQGGLVLRVPPVEILRIDAKEETIEDLLGLDQEIGVNLFQGILEDHKPKLARLSQENGILRKGEDQIRQFLIPWLRGLGYSAVSLRFDFAPLVGQLLPPLDPESLGDNYGQ
jgi:hypothetical protein